MAPVGEVDLVSRTALRNYLVMRLPQRVRPQVAFGRSRRHGAPRRNRSDRCRSPCGRASRTRKFVLVRVVPREGAPWAGYLTTYRSCVKACSCAGTTSSGPATITSSRIRRQGRAGPARPAAAGRTPAPGSTPGCPPAASARRGGQASCTAAARSPRPAAAAIPASRGSSATGEIRHDRHSISDSAASATKA